MRARRVVAVALLGLAACHTSVLAPTVTVGVGAIAREWTPSFGCEEPSLEVRLALDGVWLLGGGDFNQYPPGTLGTVEPSFVPVTLPWAVTFETLERARLYLDYRTPCGRTVTEIETTRVLRDGSSGPLEGPGRGLVTGVAR